MDSKVPIKKACEIADIDRARFNEAVAARHYLDAPEASHGTSRMFGENDLIALVSYGMRLSDGFPPRVAGHYTGMLRRALDECDDHENAVVIRVSAAGIREAFPASKAPEISVAFAGGPPVHREERINIKMLREFVRKHMEDDS